MNWLARWLARDRLENQLARELQFHFDQRVEDYRACGHSPDEARRLARLELGGIEQSKEACRDARGRSAGPDRHATLSRRANQYPDAHGGGS